MTTVSGALPGMMTDRVKRVMSMTRDTHPVTTLTETAIDDYVSLAEITGVDAYRRDLGDVRALASSVSEIGLSVPVAVTRGDKTLVAGARRVAAVRLIGLDTVPVRYVDDLTDAVTLMLTERVVDICRLSARPSELVAHGAVLERLPRPAPLTYNNLRWSLNSLVGKALGISGSNYRRAKVLVLSAGRGDADALQAMIRMDKTGKITPAYNEFTGRPSAPAGQKPGPEPESEPEPEPTLSLATSEKKDNIDWIPPKNDRSPGASQRRRELITRWGNLSYSSTQIGDRLGIQPETVRRIARELSVQLPADLALGRGSIGRRLDSNRVVRETLNDLGNVKMTLDLIRFEDLDHAQLAEWIDDLGNFIRMIGRFHTRLRKMVSE